VVLIQPEEDACPSCLVPTRSSSGGKSGRGPVVEEAHCRVPRGAATRHQDQGGASQGRARTSPTARRARGGEALKAALVARTSRDCSHRPQVDGGRQERPTTCPALPPGFFSARPHPNPGQTNVKAPDVCGLAHRGEKVIPATVRAGPETDPRGPRRRPRAPRRRPDVDPATKPQIFVAHDAGFTGVVGEVRPKKGLKAMRCPSWPANGSSGRLGGPDFPDFLYRDPRRGPEVPQAALPRSLSEAPPLVTH